MTKLERPSATKWAIALIYLILATSLIFLIFSRWGNDDPFITYRYAQNLATGGGFVYNPGERVLSTTTPLFTLLLATATPIWKMLFGGSMPQLANLIGAFSLALGGLFLWMSASLRAANGEQRAVVVLKRPVEHHRWVGWAGLLLYPTFPLLVSTLGSEMPLYLAFCLGALTFYAWRSYILAAILIALAVLTRPDGFLLAGLLVLDYLFQRVRTVVLNRQPVPWRAGLVFAGLALPWFIFAWGYFGSPIPVTLAAKQHQGLMIISQRFAPGLLTILRPNLKEWFFWIEAALGLAGLFWFIRSIEYNLAVVLNRKAQYRSWVLLFLWTGLYFGAYSLLGVSRYFWYYAPLAPGWIVAVGLGITACSHYCEAVLQSYPRAAHRNGSGGHLGEAETAPELQKARISRLYSTARIPWATLLPAALIALLAVGQIARLGQMRATPDPRLLVYRAVGEWLKENTSANARVGTLEVGVIGYYAQRVIIDFAGLLQPEVATRLGSDTTYADSAEWAVANYLPDILVLQAGLFPGLENGYVPQHCQLVKQYPGETFGYSYNVNIYHCVA